MFTFVNHIQYFSLALSLHCSLSFIPAIANRACQGRDTPMVGGNGISPHYFKKLLVALMQKVRCYSLVSLQLKNFQLLIELLIHPISLSHASRHSFQTFLYSTFFLSLNLLYLALEDGSPVFQQVYTRCTFMVYLNVKKIYKDV
jgi:hypothetical protein